MTRAGVVLFMKAPVPGRCKTRLVPEVAPADAAELYRAFCLDGLDAVRLLPADVWLAYDAHPEFPTPAWTGTKTRFFFQEGANLGQRLIHAFRTMFEKGHKRVVALGTDAPSLPGERVEEAFRALESHDAVFGPAEDGGYYLAGLARFLPELFHNIPWSTSEVMACTRENISRHGVKTFFLSPHYDVDTAADLRRLAHDLSHAHSCPRTQALLDRWMQKQDLAALFQRTRPSGLST
jgi:uncharacterized protein